MYCSLLGYCKSILFTPSELPELKTVNFPNLQISNPLSWIWSDIHGQFIDPSSKDMTKLTEFEVFEVQTNTSCKVFCVSYIFLPAILYAKLVSLHFSDGAEIAKRKRSDASEYIWPRAGQSIRRSVCRNYHKGHGGRRSITMTGTFDICLPIDLTPRSHK